ncbi:nuclear transport factor 2 family protein [Nocardioides acrostichi]|uniref:Nuclear transport factor 2 family protein n=1 Tax=Nocardioides acrostichi TaxID=2784339 RepID=A0A930UXP9_9ACTN|nr:nuclear transport factor 2 family protein [Nocardioides acrostichi]MBF4161607.1 nuclear transport factor 2 family protein [Nocardioides acrostichi]
MTTIDWNNTTPIDPADLPAVITRHIAAHHAHDIDAEMACFGQGATVTDDGQTYTGTAEIRAWLGRATSEYSYTIEVAGASRADVLHYDVVQRLEGDFPGGTVDLHYRFTLADGSTVVDLQIGV